ncbi:1-propanol dehydrogenase PduQ [Photobacterium lipolyticum]|uniref:Alcohol dehydrogenase n=1 Tax=Photobacterium lipolyticum TaxID=266810 RepID=A0A2T3MTE5_9GAMM|nr:1-propanol dehydrogenase PduQ [Photobacterium lipolyticum]PSW02577.1 alcohol dehydrogenase [Photobacterium lipolyticum]
MSEFLIKPKIHFGANALESIGALEARCAFIVTDKAMVKFGIAEKVCTILQNNNIDYHLYDDVESDPDISAIVKGMKLMDNNYPDLVIALGGGSVIDAAKAVIYSLWHCRKESGRAKPCFVAIPTTSGTGSEVTSFSVIKARKEKLVIVDEFMLPDIAILDPELVKSVPASITADTGMDVLCHALEAYVSRNASDFTDALAEKTVKLVFKHLIDCYHHGDNLEARERMHNASCIAGMAFTNASLGITHSLAHALGGVFGIPHGRANALLLSHVVAFNADLHGSCNTDAGQKYAELARLIGLPSSNTREGVTSLIVAINVLKEEMNIPAGIRNIGISEQDFLNSINDLVEQALRDSCTPTNPREARAHQMETLYRQAFAGVTHSI